MPKPPDDHDSLDDVLSQVEDALDALNLGPGETRQNLLDGVRDAIRSMAELDAPVHPEVFVLDEHDDLGPGLRVVDTEEAERIHENQADREVRFRVVQPHPQAAARLPMPLEAEGTISVKGDEPEGWQTVFRGESSRAYRIAAATGTLVLALDGVLAERVSAGQTCDVEGRMIRVRAANEVDASGSYSRL
jgi:hypothetical protein